MDIVMYTSLVLQVNNQHKRLDAMPRYDMIVFTHLLLGEADAETLRPNIQTPVLRQQGALNPRPQDVAHELFRNQEFSTPRICFRSNTKCCAKYGSTSRPFNRRRAASDCRVLRSIKPRRPSGDLA